MKKLKGVAAMAPPPHAGYEDPRTTFKHHSLMQDYLELHKETEGVKEKLVRMKQKKLTLMDEVRFLRRRYKFLVKKQSPNPPPKRDLKQPQKPEIQSRNNVKKRIYKAKEAPLQSPALGIDLNQKGMVYNGKQALSFDLNQGTTCGGKERAFNGKEATTPIFDLNQISREEEEELNSGPPLEPRKSSMRIVGDEDMKLSGCRNIGNGNSGAGKRKITWQDQVALRV